MTESNEAKKPETTGAGSPEISETEKSDGHNTQDSEKKFTAINDGDKKEPNNPKDPEKKIFGRPHADKNDLDKEESDKKEPDTNELDKQKQQSDSQKEEGDSDKKQGDSENPDAKKSESKKRKRAKKKKKPIKGKIKQVNVWGVVALILFIITLAVVGYYGYLQLEISSKEKELAEREQELIDLTMQYAEERNEIGIKKYNAARDIALSADSVDWKESTEYLIDIYDQLRALDNENRTFQFESYQIGSSEVVIRGSVAGFTSAYAEGGLIDSISDFDFVRGFDLPGYNEADGEFTFTLTIDIFEYEG